MSQKTEFNTSTSVKYSNLKFLNPAIFHSDEGNLCHKFFNHVFISSHTTVILIKDVFWNSTIHLKTTTVRRMDLTG
jgi:hypothetical protein